MLTPNTMNIELIGPINYYLGMGLEIISAIILGGLIGLDRESKNKAAGFKTHILICLGATLYTAISFLNLAAGSGPVDPNRVAAQIVSGIGFLGAGAIFRGEGSISGLTTAAGIWVVAAVGVAIGSGYIISAIIFTITVLVVLKMLDPLHRYLRPEVDYLIEIIGGHASQEKAYKVVEKISDQIHFYEVFEDSTNSAREIARIYIKVSPKAIKSLIRAVRRVEKVELINYRLLKEVPEFESKKA